MTRFIAALLLTAALTFTLLTLAASAAGWKPDPHNFHLRPSPHNFRPGHAPTLLALGAPARTSLEGH